MRPIFRVSGIGFVLTGPNSRLLRCEVVDQEGRDSDSVTIELDDRNAEIAIPSRGANLSVAMGYQETGLFPMGQFIVDEVTVDGWPRTMTIRGRAADLREDWKEGRTQDYHNKTLQQIVQEIAGRHGLGARVLGPFANHKYTYLGQTEESDLHFITRLATKHDATAKPAGGVLIFAKKGIAIGSAVARYPDNVKSYSCTFKDRPRHSTTQGPWWDLNKVERIEEIGSGGSGGPKFQLPPMFPDGKEEALAAAQARADKLARDEKNLSITVIGDPAVMAEAILTVIGVRPGVDGVYRIKTATHTIDNSGYETKIDAELPGAGGNQEE